jgi:hypothetical protein
MNNVRPRTNYKGRLHCVHGENRVHGSNVDIKAIAEIYKVSVSIYFAPDSRITQALIVIVGQVVTDRNLSLVGHL